MATKTWKLGEIAQGGVITVEIKGKVITVIGKEWDFSTGSKKGSNQTNAKEFTRGTELSTDPDARNKVENFLCELSTSYWADTILKWIETKVTFKTNLNW